MQGIANADDHQRVVADMMIGYQQLVSERVDAGWSAYLVTLMFHHLPGKPETVLSQMFDEAERFYRRLLTRVVRRPRAASVLGSLPIMVVAPDMPVGKTGKPLRDVVVNGGLHLHGVLVVPPFSRLRVPVDEHVRSELSFYLGVGDDRRPRLAAIDVRPIEQGVAPVVSYGLKSLARARFSPDDVLVLPRASSELRPAYRAKALRVPTTDPSGRPEDRA